MIAKLPLIVTVTVLASMLLASPAWAACPRGPVTLPARPACIPEVGGFMDGREVERCEDDVRVYLVRAKAVMDCGDGTMRQRMQNALRQTKYDFEDAVDGLMATAPSQPGVPGTPNSPPDVGGVPAGSRSGMAVRTSGGPTPAEQGVFVDGTSYGVPRESGGAPEYPPGPPYPGPGRPPR